MRQLPQIQGNNAFAGLQGHKCISLTTFRKNGKPVPTPVSFAVESGKLYVMTGTKTGKLKRIRNNPKVQLAPCTMRGKVVGSTIEAVARILPTGEEALARRVLKTNQGLMMRMFGTISRLLDGDVRVCLEILPVKEEK